MNRRPTNSEMILTALELVLAWCIWDLGLPGAAGLLAGMTIGTFISRRANGR